MRTISLEILRHGPPHNQLLSPLTQYLALCENHAAVTIHVPFEHNQFLYRLRALGYKLGDEARIFQIKDTANVIGDVLAEIPGLTAELSREQDEQERLTHLRLIISASELALLPFEMALAPHGFPGAGQSLLLQSQMPLCLTREIRRVTEEPLQWPDKPRILFAAAAPPDTWPIPVEAHLLALRRVITPWLKYYDSTDAAKRKERIAEHLVFLPYASAESIEEACAHGEYTHVHLLAHGVEMQDGYDVRFGLALHNARDPQGPRDVVSGVRLATALRASAKPDGRGLARPVVVTLASCNSGNVGSVAGAGASIAHALHESGIPMVVAGQFPLSFAGSVRLVEVLYEGLLWGTDPRLLLSDLRRRLYAQFPQTHDWAGLTAYASLPPDLPQQLANVQIGQALQSINVAMGYADEAIQRVTPRLQKTPQVTDEALNQELLEHTRQKINTAKRRLEDLLVQMPARRARICGLLASTEKRQAQVLHSLTLISTIDEETRQKDHAESVCGLQKSRDYYWESFLADSAGSWAVVQYLSLTFVLQNSNWLPLFNPSPDPSHTLRQPQKGLHALWAMAHILSMNDLHSDNQDRVEWAYGNLVELYLLSLLMPSGSERPDPVEAERWALEYTRELVAVAGRDSFEVYSTRRQILRYLVWFGLIHAPDGIGGFSLLPDWGNMLSLAERIFNELPEGIEEKWR